LHALIKNILLLKIANDLSLQQVTIFFAAGGFDSMLVVTARSS
jgi:hypothetical protein